MSEAAPTAVVENLAELQSAVQRTQTIEVISRTALKSPDGEYKEVEIPTKVFVRPLQSRKWFKAFGHVNTLLENLPSEGVDFTDEYQLGIALLELAGSCPDAIFGIVGLAIDQPIEFFDAIDPDDLIRIVMAAVKVNKDFFVQKVLPLISEIAPEVKAAIAGTLGQTE